MENKINIGRVILGGIAGGIVMLAIGFVIHAVLLEEYYVHFQSVGSVLAEPRPGIGSILMFPITILLGIPLAFLYVLSRKHLGAGPKTALIVGFLVGLMGLSVASTMYSFYNLGRMIPFGMGVDFMLECIAGTLIAGLLYKDK